MKNLVKDSVFTPLISRLRFFRIFLRSNLYALHSTNALEKLNNVSGLIDEYSQFWSAKPLTRLDRNQWSEISSIVLKIETLVLQRQTVTQGVVIRPESCVAIRPTRCDCLEILSVVQISIHVSSIHESLLNLLTYLVT